jgi:uncharacterized membrane protein YfhO
VRQVEKADRVEILKHIIARSFNPREKAYVEEDVPPLSAVDSTNMAQAEITSYGIQDIRIKATAPSDQFLFISEIYYSAWKCYIDGQETKIYKTNYAFRGVVVPKGTHEIRLVYESRAFEIGRWLSIGANLLLLAMFAFAAFVAIQQRRTTQPAVDSAPTPNGK